MTLWEFMAARDGYLISQGAKPKGREIDDSRLAELGIEGF